MPLLLTEALGLETSSTGATDRETHADSVGLSAYQTENDAHARRYVKKPLDRDAPRSGEQWYQMCTD